MDDAAFQDWSDALAILRQARQIAIEEGIQSKADSFSPTEYFDLATGSLDQIMNKWFEFEHQSWEVHPPADLNEAMQATRGEMESIIDFETDAIQRDIVLIQSRITWDPGAVSQAEPGYLTFVDELRKKYQLKLKSLSGPPKKRETAPVGPVRHAGSSGSSGGSGMGLFLMFVVGLLLGGGPSIYFMDGSKKLDRKYQEERSKMLSEQRALADSMQLLHDGFDKLATGKLRSMPELDREIQAIKAGNARKREEIERTNARSREKTLKKIPAGGRLDRALEELQNEKNAQLANLKTQEAAEIEPLVKQQTVLKDLISH